MTFNWYSKYKLKLFRPKLYPIIRVNNKKFLFIHINRNAGTSIIKAFGKKKFHLTTRELITLPGEKSFEDAIKFTVVRNPYDRVISHYAHRTKTNQSNMHKDNIDINTWIKKVYGKEKDPKYYKPQYKMYFTQIQWLTDKNGKIRAQHVLKFENLESELRELCELFNLKIDLPHLNKSREYKVKIETLSQDSIAIIHDHFEEDFSSFGYNYITE